MSWKSGAWFGQNWWDRVREYIPEDKRQVLASELLGLLEDGDADFYGHENIWKDAGREVENDE